MMHETTEKRRSYKPLVMVLIALVIIAPLKANASVAEIIMLLHTITATLQQEIGQVLNKVQGVEASISATRQQVAWPVSAIKQAQSLTSQMRIQYVPLLQTIRQIPVNSATLQAPLNFESMLRSQNALSAGAATQHYIGVYRQTPSSTDAAPFERNVVDMDDALALASLKQTVSSDQVSAQILNIANSLEQQTANMAPGSAVYLNVEAQLASLHTQAQSLKIIAAQLRVEAGTLAHDNALLKKRAINAQQLRDDLRNVFSRSQQ